MKGTLQTFQTLGRALMLPIAVLPAAGLLLRIGQPDLLNLPFVAAAGAALFSSLGLLFAIGVAIGFARESHGAAALAGVVCYLIATKGGEVLISVPPDALAGVPARLTDVVVEGLKTKAMSGLMVPVGILSGLVGGVFYNRFATIKLPDYLAFFGGRRFVPLVAALAGLFMAAALGFGYAPIRAGIDALSHAILQSGVVGVFAYGVLNRVLIITGLHHILNNVVWFVVGDYHGVTGDLNRFAAGDPTAGAFMAGYFPIMMFGLPAACLAMYHTAKTSEKRAAAGLLLSLALTSFLTGVTEPIEFSFIFVAPVLYGIHAVLTGLSMALLYVLHVRLGFGFSAGLIDYVLNFNKSERPLWLIPIGLATFCIYYVLFRFAITRFDLKTPGREVVTPSVPGEATADEGPAPSRGAAYAAALGGAANLRSVEACTTRLRLVVVDPAQVDEPRLKTLGARGVIRPSSDTVQVVLGPIADAVADEIRISLRTAPPAPPAPAAPPPAPAERAVLQTVVEDAPLADRLLEALGGRANVLDLHMGPSRLLVRLRQPERIDRASLTAAGARAAAFGEGGGLHLLLSPAAIEAAGPVLTRRLAQPSALSSAITS